MFKFIHQHDQTDCGPACLAMIANFYGKKISLQYLREITAITKEGVSILGISKAAEIIGFETLSVKADYYELLENTNFLPCILFWNQNHFVVLIKITKNPFRKTINFVIADPAFGIIKISELDFKKGYINHKNKGHILYLQKSNKLNIIDIPKVKKISAKFILKHLYPHKLKIILLFVLLILGSALTLFFPFLTQNLIDKGVIKKNIAFVWVVLISQLLIFMGSITIDIIRDWITLHIGTKISINIISDFLKKLLELPIKFFDTKMIGDFNQRIQDNERIENFLTTQGLLTIFSILTFTVFFGVLWYYDFKILLVYLVLTILSIIWFSFWLKNRKLLDHKYFQCKSNNQQAIYEFLNGVIEMKLNDFETLKRKEWKKIQQQLYQINIKILKIGQIQLIGFHFLNQIKNILVTFISATAVIKGKISLGELMSISYIIGQMNSPVNQLVNFLKSSQDAKLSIERLSDIQEQKAEASNDDIIITKKVEKGIQIENLTFNYEDDSSKNVLQDISFCIPKGKITAVVGASGSGKTTLLKLLLKFYEPIKGRIKYDNLDLKNISPKSWRKQCGVVMQDGFIFSDTIEKNITTSDEITNYNSLEQAIHIANIKEFIQELPLGFKTKIGDTGNSISGGQKQRILIARAVYKDPQFIFFDEATSSLDAENEKIIHDNLQSFFKGKTVLVIAHRLSTVKNANQIIVLNKGEIIEIGTHEELIRKKQSYYQLIKNQLELGN